MRLDAKGASSLCNSSEDSEKGKRATTVENVSPSLSLSICIYNKLIAYDRILDLRLSPVFSHLHFIPLVQAGPLALFLYKVRFVPLAGNRSTWLFHPLNNKSMHQVVFHDF